MTVLIDRRGRPLWPCYLLHTSIDVVNQAAADSAVSCAILSPMSQYTLLHTFMVPPGFTGSLMKHTASRSHSRLIKASDLFTVERWMFMLLIVSLKLAMTN